MKGCSTWPGATHYLGPGGWVVRVTSFPFLFRNPNGPTVWPTRLVTAWYTRGRKMTLQQASHSTIQVLIRLLDMNPRILNLLATQISRSNIPKLIFYGPAIPIFFRPHYHFVHPLNLGLYAMFILIYTRYGWPNLTSSKVFFLLRS